MRTTPAALARAWWLRATVPLVVGLLLASSGCGTTVVIKESDKPLLTHALFIENSGVPARLVGADRRILEPPANDDSRYTFASNLFSPDLRPRLPEHARDFGHWLRAIQDTLEAGLKASPREVVLIIHGGRNTLAEPMEEQLAILDSMRSESRKRVFPLFIKYESEDLSSYCEHLIYTRPAKTNLAVRGWRIFRAPWTLITDVAQGVGRIPLNTYQQLSREFDTLVGKKLELPTCARGMEDHLQVPTRGQSGWGRTRDALLALPAVALRIPVDAVVATMGPGEWESMKRRAQVMLTIDQNYVPSVHRHSDPSVCAPTRADVGLGSVGKLIDMLHSVAHKHPGKLSVSIIAHSTGAIVACNMVQMGRVMEIPWKNIVFMAAACTINDFDAKVRPVLEERLAGELHATKTRPDAPTAATERPSPPPPPMNFYNLTLHPTAELQEFGYPAGLLVRGTLLVWIDSFLAPLGSFRDRTLGRAENALPYMSTLPTSLIERCYLKVFDYGRDAQRRRVPMKHSDFMRLGTRFWDPTFWEPHQEGAIPEPDSLKTRPPREERTHEKLPRFTP